MATGIVSLKQLYDFAEADSNCEALEGVSPKGHEYGRLVNRQLVRNIPQVPGICLFGAYKSNKAWVNIYLGRSNDLKYYIRKSLSDNRVVIYRKFKTEKELLHKYMQIHNRLDYWRNALQAFDNFSFATHFVWHASSDTSVESLKNTLLEILNPTGNINNAVSNFTLYEEAIRVVSEIGSVIDNERLGNIFYADFRNTAPHFPL